MRGVRGKDRSVRFRGARHQLQRLVRYLALVYAIAVLLLAVLHVIAPPRSGVLALTVVFAPYLYAPLVLLLPLILWYPDRALRVATAASALVFIATFGPALISPAPFRHPGDSQGTMVRVSAITWNARASNHQIGDITRVLTASPVGIVALQEITVAESAALARSATIREHYPFQVLAPHPLQEQLESIDGMALLSRYPILEHGVFTAPAGIWARLDLGLGRQLMVINATPARARLDRLQYDPSTRDAHIRSLRGYIDPLLRREEPLLVLGDFNVTPLEPAYGELTAGLQDAHLEVGFGFGNTWRPGPLASLPLALLRIDYQLSSSQLRALSIDVDCAPHRSDHCIVRADFALVPQ